MRKCFTFWAYISKVGGTKRKASIFLEYLFCNTLTEQNYNIDIRKKGAIGER